MHPFQTAIEARDIDAALALLADDVEFHSPVVFTPYRGRTTVAPILDAVSRVFEDFRYVRTIESSDGTDHALVFRARIGETDIEGTDILRVTPDGMIGELTVLVRPLRAVRALADAMRARLAVSPS